MLLYAQDAMETYKPWERWEWRDPRYSVVWRDFSSAHEGPDWTPDYEYRRKPRTIRIGDHDVPEPMRVAPEYGATYWVAEPSVDEFVRPYRCYGDDTDRRHLSRGLCHATREAALRHARALLSFTTAESQA